MESTDLLFVCLAAFIAVFTLLAALALVMRGLTALFPERVSGTDAAHLAAITAATSVAYPGMKIKSMREEK